MFGWFKKRRAASSVGETIASQPPGEVFPWAKGWRLTAIDEAVVMVPAQVLSNDEPIGSVIQCSDNVRLNLPTDSPHSLEARILIWLQPGQSVWLTKSCQAMVLPSNENDKAVRRFKLSKVASDNG